MSLQVCELCIIEGNFCFDFKVLCTLVNIEEWNQDDFKDDKNENLETKNLKQKQKKKITDFFNK